MKKIVKKIFTILLLISLLFANLPVVSAETEEELPKSNTATNLDDNFDTKIVLSLNPELPEKQIMDIVFVAGAETFKSTNGTKFVENVYDLVDELNSQKNIKVNIAIVAFGNGSKKILDLTSTKEFTTKESLETVINAEDTWLSNNTVQSNLQSGLILTKDILDNSDTGSKKENRHVILYTDGAHFTYNNAKGQTANATYKIGTHSYLTMSNMDSNGDVGDPNRDIKITNYLAETHSYKGAFEKLMLEIDDIDALAKTRYKWGSEGNATEIEALVDAGQLVIYSSSRQVDNIETYPYTGMEMGTALAARELNNIKSENYTIHTIGFQYRYGFDNNGNLEAKVLGTPSVCFLNWTANVGSLIMNDSINMSDQQFEETFTELRNELIPAVPKDTYLITEMGFGKYDDGSDYDFDFVNDVHSLGVAVLGEFLDVEEIDANTYGFGKDASLQEGYKIILQYFPNGIEGITENECLKININHDYEGGTPINIEFHEILTEESRKNQSGIYGEYDKDGSANLSSLRTSNSTILYLSNGKTEKFKNPNLSYEVKAGLKNPDTSNNILMYVTIAVIALALFTALRHIHIKTKLVHD